jgi:hypothetical protein
MIRFVLALSLISSSVIAAEEQGAGPPTEAERAKGVELLKRAYILNGNSMVGYGFTPEMEQPRVVPTDRVKPTGKGDKLR